MPTVPTLRTIEEQLAWNYWDAFTQAFIRNEQTIARIMQAADEGASEIDLDHDFSVSELAWVQAHEEVKQYLELTGEPFEALGYFFRLDMNGEVEMVSAGNYSRPEPRKTNWRDAAERYLAKHPERIEADYPFQVP